MVAHFIFKFDGLQKLSGPAVSRMTNTYVIRNLMKKKITSMAKVII